MILNPFQALQYVVESVPQPKRTAKMIHTAEGRCFGMTIGLKKRSWHVFEIFLSSLMDFSFYFPLIFCSNLHTPAPVSYLRACLKEAKNDHYTNELKTLDGIVCD